MRKMGKNIFKSLMLTLSLVVCIFNVNAYAESYHSNSNTTGQVFFNSMIPFYVTLYARVNTYYSTNYIDKVNTYGRVPEAPEQLWEIGTKDILINARGYKLAYTSSPESYDMFGDSGYFYGGNQLIVGQEVYSGSTVVSSANMWAVEDNNSWNLENYVTDGFTMP